MDRRAVLTIITFIALLLASIAAISYNKGYRPNFGQKNEPVVRGTGVLVATSTPNGAQVFLNDSLATATNNTLSLPPGSYTVKIAKDGYIPWEKKLQIKEGVVTEAQARLFPAAPDLRAETTMGALLPTLSPDGSKLVYGVASGSAEKRGIWVMDLTERPLLAQAQSRKITDNFAEANFIWSPDSKEVIVSDIYLNFLLEADRFNSVPQNITSTLDAVLESWENDVRTKENDRISNLKPKLIKELQKMKIIDWSPDETKILYTATQSGILSLILEKPLVGTSTQTEERDLKKGGTYVYDLKEDKNFLITGASPEEKKSQKSPPAQTEISSPSGTLIKIGKSQRAQSLRWFPDSRHLIQTGEKEISILEYDGTNKDVVYSGPFENSFVYPWPNASKLVILTTYNRPAGVVPNLYSISLQ